MMREMFSIKFEQTKGFHQKSTGHEIKLLDYKISSNIHQPDSGTKIDIPLLIITISQSKAKPLMQHTDPYTLPPPPHVGLKVRPSFLPNCCILSHHPRPTLSCQPSTSATVTNAG